MTVSVFWGVFEVIKLSVIGAFEVILSSQDNLGAQDNLTRFLLMTKLTQFEELGLKFFTKCVNKNNVAFLGFCIYCLT